MIISALVQIMLDVGVRRVSQPPPPYPKEKMVRCHCLTLCAPKHSRRAQTRSVPWWGEGYPTNHLKAMTTNDQICHRKKFLKLQREHNLNQREEKRVKTSRRTSTQPKTNRDETTQQALAPVSSHHDAKHSNCQNKAAGPRMDGINRFGKLQREQNSTNQTTNASKLDKTRRNPTTTTNEENETALILHQS